LSSTTISFHILSITQVPTTSANAVAEQTRAEETRAEETIVEEPAAIVEKPARLKRGSQKTG
jgi:hypothetical protein